VGKRLNGKLETWKPVLQVTAFTAFRKAANCKTGKL
jgi:hypothetical protein